MVNWSVSDAENERFLRWGPVDGSHSSQQATAVTALF